MGLLRSLGRRVCNSYYSLYDRVFPNLLVHFFIVLEMHEIMSFEAWLAEFTSSDLETLERGPFHWRKPQEKSRDVSRELCGLFLTFQNSKFYILSSASPLSSSIGALSMRARCFSEINTARGNFEN